MTAAMPISPLVQVREIPDEASLSVLGHCGEGVEAACYDDSAAQVDGTGRTTINMLINNKYISPHNYKVLYSKSKL